MTQLKKTWIIIFLILTATLLCYFPSFSNSFVNYDDSLLLFENKIIHDYSFSNAIKIFETHLKGDHSRFDPLVFIVYMTTKHFFGFNPLWFHLTSLLFHLGCVIAVFWLTFLLTRNTFMSAAASLLFGIHPIHVEAVAWASALMHVMYSFFYLVTLALFLKGLQSPSQKPYAFILSFFSFLICGCCFSAGAITLPFILLLLCCWQDNFLKLKRFFMLAPFFLVSVFLTWITLFTAKHSQIIANPYFNLETSPLSERIHLSSLGIFHYLSQLLAPLNFAIIYPEGYYLHSLNFLYSLLLAAGFLGLFLLYRKKPAQIKPFLFGFLFFFIVLLPFSKLYSTTNSLTNDRYCYLASYGIFLVLAAWANLLIKQQRLLIKIILGTLVFYLLLNTWAICHNWQNGETLWSNEIRLYPRAYPAYLGRADYYSQDGQYQRSLADLNTALLLKPDYTDALRQKATVFLLSNDPQAAIEIYTLLLHSNPDDVASLNNRAAGYLILSLPDQAKTDLDKSINLDAQQVDPYYNRSIIFAEQKQYALALKDLEFILAADPGHELAQSEYQKLKKLLPADEQ